MYCLKCMLQQFQDNFALLGHSGNPLAVTDAEELAAMSVEDGLRDEAKETQAESSYRRQKAQLNVDLDTQTVNSTIYEISRCSFYKSRTRQAPLQKLELLQELQRYHQFFQPGLHTQEQDSDQYAGR